MPKFVTGALAGLAADLSGLAHEAIAKSADTSVMSDRIPVYSLDADQSGAPAPHSLSFDFATKTFCQGSVAMRKSDLMQVKTLRAGQVPCLMTVLAIALLLLSLIGFPLMSLPPAAPAMEHVLGLALLLGIILLITAYRDQMLITAAPWGSGIFLPTISLQPAASTRRNTFEERWRAGGIF